MSSLSKMLSILDLYTVERPAWSAEAICAHLRVSVPTGYRYVRELVNAGLLLRHGDGTYGLGTRIITLDYQLRTIDPLYRIGQPLMQALAAQTGCDCVMTRLFNDQVIDTHRESGPDGLHLSYGRGRPRPLFHGGAPKVILSTMPKARLLKLYAKHASAIADADMGQSADEFVARLHDTRRAGYYISKGELEPDIAAIAVPLASASSGGTGPAAGALALVLPLRRFEFMNHDKLLEWLRDTAARIASGARMPDVDR